MSECTTCSYYGKHLEKRAEDMPWPCVECAGGEKYAERGKRKHQVPLRVQLAELLARHNALVEAVKWERECEGFDPFFHSSFTAPSWLSRHAESHRTKQAARAEVGRLIGEE